MYIGIGKLGIGFGKLSRITFIIFESKCELYILLYHCLLQSTHLPEPYDYCREESLDTLPDEPYTLTLCRRNCTASVLSSACGCVPPYLSGKWEIINTFK